MPREEIEANSFSRAPRFIRVGRFQQPQANERPRHIRSPARSLLKV